MPRAQSPPHPPRPHRPPPTAGSVRSKSPTASCPFRRSSTPSIPASAPLFTRTRCPALRNGCGSARTPVARLALSASISCSGSGAGVPSKTTNRTTPGTCCTRSRSPQSHPHEDVPGETAAGPTLRDGPSTAAPTCTEEESAAPLSSPAVRIPASRGSHRCTPHTTWEPNRRSPSNRTSARWLWNARFIRP